VVRGDGRLKDFMQIGLEPSVRSFLIGLAQATVAGDIGDQDGGESALHAPVPGWRRDRTQAELRSLWRMLPVVRTGSSSEPSGIVVPSAMGG
jgi:hypothetical protein